MRSPLTILLALWLLLPRLGEAQSASQPAVSDSAGRQAAKALPCPGVPGGRPVKDIDDSIKAKGAPGGMATDSNCAATMAAMAAAQAQMSPEQRAQLQAMMSPAQMAQLKGQMSPDLVAQMQALVNPAQMAQLKGQMSPELLAQMQAQMSPAQLALMQGSELPSGQMPVGEPEMTPSAGGPEMAMPGMAGTPGEAGGKRVELSSDLVGDLKKGKAVVRNIDWTPGTGAVTAEGSEGFTRAMVQVVAAMKQAGGAYRVDLYMDQQSGAVVVRTLGPRRLRTVQALLAKGGATPQIGDARKDGDPRLEIVRLK